MWRCGGKCCRAIVGALAAGARGEGEADVEDAAVCAREMIGRRGWVPDPEALAVERLLLACPGAG